jgi:hypothetical protein
MRRLQALHAPERVQERRGDHFAGGMVRAVGKKRLMAALSE